MTTTTSFYSRPLFFRSTPSPSRQIPHYRPSGYTNSLQFHTSHVYSVPVLTRIKWLQTHLLVRKRNGPYFPTVSSRFATAYTSPATCHFVPTSSQTTMTPQSLDIQVNIRPWNLSSAIIGGRESLMMSDDMSKDAKPVNGLKPNELHVPLRFTLTNHPLVPGKSSPWTSSALYQNRKVTTRFSSL